MSANLYSLFRSRFRERLEHTFVETFEDRLSYAALDDETARCAGFLSELGVAKGDRVLVQADKSPGVLIVYLACLRADAIFMPLNTAYQRQELEYFLDDARPAVVIADAPRLATLRELAAARGIEQVHALEGLPQRWAGTEALEPVACAGGDGAAIIYTSGTTGRPKGALLTHGNLAANAQALDQAWDWRADDVLVHALPLFHVHGLFVACHCVLLGASRMIFLARFDVDTVLAALPRATVLMGVPTFYTRLLASAQLDREACRNMRLFICGSAPLQTQTFDDFRARTGHTILERYGMTETGMNLSNPVAGPRIAGTVGQPLPGVSVRIADDTGRLVGEGAVGRLLVKGDNVFPGYWGMPEKTAEEFTDDGYFDTGDLARVGDNGAIVIVGRSKDLIISGGYNVYPAEVEGYIDALDGIAESAVIGLPHFDLGEAVVAVCARETSSQIDEATVIDALKATVAGYKAPKRVVFVDAVPRNTMGKVQKAALRERYGQEIEW